ncbi:hypothetical protein A4A49_07360 [Nicotiana attenuata]|uniref:Uncharacterized protein n=1 Tax=Nicotiana attenuata TaxID=49451 RepID=A0A314LDR0_NICAT|nr:hypothetical protein A4A49_07360 [Nicotiana attenuata]
MMGNQASLPTSLHSQTSKAKKHKNGKKSDHSHNHHLPITTGPPTGLLVGGGIVGIGTLLRIHTRQQENHPNCAEPGSPCESHSESPQQGPDGIWTTAMAVDGQQRQPGPNHRPTNPKQPYSPKLSITTLLPGLDEGGSNGGAFFHSTPHPTNPQHITSEENTSLTPTAEHPSRNHHSTGDSQGEGCFKRAGAELPSASNGLNVARLSEIDRVQYTSERSSGGLVSQGDVQMWTELSPSSHTRSVESPVEFNPHPEPEKEVTTRLSAHPLWQSH